MRRNRQAEKSQSVGMKGENEVKRKVLYIVGIRVWLAYLSIYGKQWAYIENTK